MSIFKNVFFAVVLGVVAWFLYVQFTESPILPVAQQPLPFTYEATTTTYHSLVDLPATSNIVLGRSVREYAESRIAEFDQMYGPGAFSADDLATLGFTGRGMQYEQFINGEAWSSGAIDGMLVQEYDFTGGAHGGTSLTVFAYDDAGKSLHLRDLFQDGAPYVERIAEVVTPRLKADLEANEIYNEEMFGVGTKAEEGNYMLFSLDDSSITFYFNQYQVAPYVAGIRQVIVPLSELKDILSSDYF